MSLFFGGRLASSLKDDRLPELDDIPLEVPVLFAEEEGLAAAVLLEVDDFLVGFILL